MIEGIRDVKTPQILFKSQYSLTTALEKIFWGL
jgi:hypothetical protein